MPRHPLFDVSPDQIAALDDEGLRLLIARLCEADLQRRGLATSAVLYGGNQIAADGGIDVRVELPADTQIDGFIPRPATGFQAKADDMPASEIAKEMRREETQPDGTKARRLRPSIRALAADGGAYVIVSSKGSTADSRLTERRVAMRAAVADLPGSDALHLDFYDRTRMATWVRSYPGVVLWVLDRIGQPLPGWRPWGNWSCPSAADGPYLSDDTARLRDLSRPQDGQLAIEDGIMRLRARLSVSGGMVRLTGLSGTGKTRLLEALFDPGIGEQPLDAAYAIYADIGHDAPGPSVSQLAAQLRAEGNRAVLLLDNCPRETHDAIAAEIKAPGSPLSLITVDLDISDEKPENTDVFRLQGASEAVIGSLIEQRYPALSQAIRRRVAEFAGGNARIALLAADVGPETNLADLSDEWLFKRLFHQRKQADDRLLEAAEALALVFSFDGETREGEAAELPILARLAGLDVRVVRRAVGELTRREIVQSRGKWRAILPQPLANWLAKRALENQPALEIAHTFRECGNPRLLRSFAHRLSYLHDSAAAQRIAGAWLALGGPLPDLRDLINPSSDIPIDLLLKYLAPVAPNAFLNLIERFVESSTLRQLRAGECWFCKSLISILRKLAWFPEHFRRSAVLLSRLTQAESPELSGSHSSSDLECLFWARLSGSRANTQQRLELIEELLAATDDRSQESGLIALRGMLKIGPFSSGHDFTFGGRACDFGWGPETPAEKQDWYGGALCITTRLALSSSPLGAAARQAIAEAFRDLWRFPGLRGQLEGAVLAIGDQGDWPDGWLAVRRSLLVAVKRQDAELVPRLRALQDQLAPVDPLGRLRAYVLTPAHRIAELLIWECSETADPEAAASGAIFEEVRRLAREVGAAPGLLDGIWPVLFGPDAHQAFFFGEGLAEASVDVSQAWHDLLGHYAATDEESRNPSLLVGFMRATALRDRNQSNCFLDDAVVDPLLGPIFPQLQVFAGVDDVGIRRLAASAAAGLAPSRSYGCLALGKMTETIPPADLSRILLGIAGLPDGYRVATEILSMHFHSAKDEPGHWDPTLVHCGRELLRRYPPDQVDQSMDYILTTIATVCLQGAETATDARLVCQWIAAASAAHMSHWMELDGLIGTLLTLHPQIALDCWLGSTEHNQSVFAWCLVGANPLSNVSTPTLMEWAKQHPETRLPQLMEVIPVLEKQDGAPAWSEVALSLLGEATDRACMLQGLAERLRPSSWSGSLAVVLEQRRPLVQRFFDDEDPAVRQAARAIDHSLQREIDAEAEREVKRDERFE
jgi:hypothetical protein